ncbi:rhodanese-like domain-containing protein [Bacillus paralicheniformis]|uniref:Rhodanese-like domain-containing protein n=1 Tax=Bacillus paralicheniformis TaxID=1648923 RepID=A0AAW6KDQ2_9BACI|nr:MULTISPECIES: rhodanese-like domain-containing protein [Bacillus]KUL16737.1 sulfurtransferase [Bacillus licheniformis LMG 6934]MBG9883641.1 sulfurtransferase [Bacillus paralicheniformis]MCJ8222502.1 rhodanese-like domain-containing protein [Bacillus paralicheniformis]MDE1376362.1 rhodanese-like domain-containing protein [Bacillus licheniformis]MDE1381590.1 rhodanese-like domain-containing protein [Bacillus paralicheniformis]
MVSGVIINTLLILCLLWILFRRFLPLQGVKQITIADLKSELKNKDKQFIDVRTPYEFRTRHIKGFKNIPLSDLPHQTNQLSKDKAVFVICQSGMRSLKASKVLKKQGFKRITNIKGGMNAWH